MTNQMKDAAKLALTSCIVVGVVFALSYPFNVAVLRFHTPHEEVYSFVFWPLLLISIFLITLIWGKPDCSWWKAVLRGTLTGYLCSFVAYACVLVVAARTREVFRDFEHFVGTFLFLFATFGWLLGAASAGFLHLIGRVTPSIWDFAASGRLSD